MFQTAIVEPAVKVPVEELIPLVILALSLDAPPQGWAAHLADRDIEVLRDDIGREAIARSDARQLFVERAQNEARRKELLARADEAAIEYDRRFRASIGAGIPASAIPAGATYAEAMLAAELDSRTYQPHRATMAEDLFDNSGTLTFHPITQPDEE
jgi:hypothetical protein